MKKIIPILAVTALLATGCAPSTKVSEKKFDQEVTNYGCFMNKNVKFEGNGSLGVMEMKLTLESESDGSNLKLASTIKYLAEDVEVNEMKAMVIGEIKEEKFNGNMYMKETSWNVQAITNLPVEDLKAMLIEFTYLAPFKYEDVKYDSKQQAYTFERYTGTFIDGSSTIDVTFRDGSLKFKGNELVSYKYNMAVETEMVMIDITRTQKGGVTVTAPEIPA